MGINTAMARFVARARRLGTGFGDVLTVGRQSLTVPEADLAQIARFLGVADGVARTVSGDRFAERLLRELYGARSITAIDVSAYEGAALVHDLNEPLPAGLAGRFDTLLDGGTLEHLFDLKTALTNYMSLVRIGGSVFIQTNANNLCGHGFYQFSPEFFYRVFSAENGFETRDVVLVATPMISVETSRHQVAYRVVDPAAFGKRVNLVNDLPTTICVHARKIADVAPFARPMIQSDYATAPPAEAAGPVEETVPAPFAYLGWGEERRLRRRQGRECSLERGRPFSPWRMEDP